MHGIIYKAVNLINGKVYIGQTTGSLEKRIKAHAKYNKQYFGKALRKFGISGFCWEVIDEADDQKTLNKKESHYIDYYKSFDALRGYNLTTGEDRRIYADEVKIRMSERAKGRTPWNKGLSMPEESIKKMILSKKGFRHTEETKKVIASSLKGRRRPDAVKKRISESKKNAKTLLCIETGELFKSISEAGRLKGIKIRSLSNCINGRSKSSGGFHWRTLE